MDFGERSGGVAFWKQLLHSDEDGAEVRGLRRATYADPNSSASNGPGVPQERVQREISPEMLQEMLWDASGCPTQPVPLSPQVVN